MQTADRLHHVARPALVPPRPQIGAQDEHPRLASLPFSRPTPNGLSTRCHVCPQLPAIVTPLFCKGS